MAVWQEARAAAKAGRRKGRKTVFRAVLLAAALGVILTFSALNERSSKTAAFRTGRQLQDGSAAGVSCGTDPDIYEMTCECQESIGSGWDQDVPVLAFIVYVVIMLWVFLGIAVVCDDHFEAALMTICDQLNLSKAVGGATFMAAGSSAPELATSLVAVFTTRDATGLGTILGSAVFNLVAIICLSGIFGAGPYHKLTFGRDPTGEKVDAESGSSAAAVAFKTKLAEINRGHEGNEITTDGLFLDKRPLARDAFFYVVSLVLCVIFALTDVGDGWCDGVMLDPSDLDASHAACQFNGKPGFVWWEGLILSLCYAIYVHSMIIDEELMAWMEKQSITATPDHIRAYLDQLEAMDEKAKADEDEDAGDGDDFYGGFETPRPPPEGTPVKTDAAPEEVGGLLQPQPEPQADDATAYPAPVVEAPPGTTGLQIEEVHPDLIENIDKFSEKVLKDQVKILADKVAKLEAHLQRPKWEYRTVADSDDEDEEEEEEPGPLGKVSDFIVDAASKPWEVAFAITIPECERDSYQNWDEDNPIKFKDIPPEYQEVIKKKCAREGQDEPDADEDYMKGKHKKKQVDLWYSQSKRYLISFTMSIVWIGVTSWAMVALAQKMGCHLGVGSFTMGLVVLATGTSIPDALSSIVVAKGGEGDMACANAVGSNVFNIFLGIGLPMILSEITWKEPYVVPDGLPVLVSSIMLIAITILMYVGIGSQHWVLTPKLSWILLIMFPTYLILCILFDAGTINLYGGICTDERNHPLACGDLNAVVLV